MKKIIFLFIAIALHLIVLAQVPTQSAYPNAPLAATNINNYSFYVDSVGNSNEQPLAFATASTNSTIATPINLAGVTTGLHQLYVKVTTTDGVPSITNIGNFYMEGDNVYPNVPAAAMPINSYSFFIDSVGNTNEQPLAFTAALNNTTTATPINLSGVTSGFHQLYAKVTTNNGVPSITNIGNFFMDGNTFYANAPAAPTAIDRYEFFIDSVTATNIRPLSFSAALQNASPSTSIDLLGVLPGIHQLYARVFTTTNIPSIVNLGQFLMEQNFRYVDVPTAAPALQNMEYYIDTDPGYGLATPINVTGTNTTEVFNNISVSIPNNLSTGEHFFHIRSRQNPWSIDNVIPFQIGTILPVSWLYVRAQLISGSSIIQWSTASEINSKSFDVEWSVDGNTFIKIGSVNAAGNTNNISSYNYTHSNPTSGLNYYRIKQIDIDGRFTYSVVVKVNKLQERQFTEMSIFPNPAASYINLKFESSKNSFVQIYDVQGKLVISLNANNQSLIKIDIATLAKGTYVIKAIDGLSLYTGSFIKQ